MSTAAKVLTPKTVREFPEYLDFERLRSEGLRHIQNLAGNIWTDHNSHDPGITILEVLCYALTDLGYRTQLDISELIAPKEAETNGDTNFKTSAEILSCNPLTILDYRKLLIDIEGVRNAWLEPADKDAIFKQETPLVINLNLSQIEFSEKVRIPETGQDETSKPPLVINGLYRILLELDDTFIKQEKIKGNDPTERILKQVHEILHAHRNLGEDFLDIQVLKDEFISICSEIEITEKANPNDVLLGILEQVQEFLSPTIKFYTLNEMLLELGKPMDEIFEGRPLLKNSHGFINTDDLEALERRDEIHVSDIYRIILNTEGVVAIKKLVLINETNGLNKEGEEWLLPLNSAQYRPVLGALKSAQKIIFSKRDVGYTTDNQYVVSIFEKRLANRLKVLKSTDELNSAVRYGLYRQDLGEYYSIQNDLPATYGTTKVAFPSGTKTREELIRQSQALQLKGYLLFFDRLLTNYLAQLGNLRHLFSTHLDPDTDAVASLGNLNDVAILERLLPFDDSREAILLRGQMPFKKGDPIAEVYDPIAEKRRIFATPQARDSALTQIILDFDADNITVYFKEKTDTNGFYFIVESKQSRAVALRSSKNYETEAKAREAFGAVRFLATLESSYEKRLLYPATEHKYTFDWIFQFPDFQYFMRQATETRTDYFRRKEALLNHLAGRFAEDFTDYTLLMFGLSKGSPIQPTVETFARDKARFIDHYADISRNRAKGLNQLLAPPQYWLGKNISGVENRVATMLDFNRNGNKQLNFFEIVEDLRVSFVFRDRRQSILLQSPHWVYDVEFQDFKKQVKTENIDFEPFENAAEQVFGFRLRDTEGCVVAVHPDFYGSDINRNAMMRYTQLVVRDRDRLPVDYVAIDAAFYAQVLKNNKVVWRALESSKDETAAQVVGLQIRHLAADKNCYTPIDDLVLGFSFQLLRKSTDPMPLNGLAKHPIYYTTAVERNTVMNDTIQFFTKNPLKVKVAQLATRYQWVLISEGNLVLRCLHFFKTKDQANLAMRRAMEGIVEKRQYALKVGSTAAGKWFVHILQIKNYPSENPETIKTPIAITPLFNTKKEAEDAAKSLREDAQKALETIDNQEVRQNEGKPICIEIHAIEGQFKAVLVNEKNEIQLEARERYDSVMAAELAFDNVMKAACAGNWLDKNLNNGCDWGFSVTDNFGSDKIIAEHPHFYFPEEKRNEAKTVLKKWVCENFSPISVEQIIESYQWQLICPDGQIILRGVQNQTSANAAKAYFDESIRPVLINFNEGLIEKRIFEYGFDVKKDDAIIGEHPYIYPRAEICDAVIKKLVTCLTKIVSESEDGFDTIRPCECTDSNGKIRNKAPHRWRVRDAYDCLAIYKTVFETKVAAQEALHKLAKSHRCTPPQYSCIVVGNGALVSDGLGSWHWAVRSSTQFFWRSPKNFASKQEAKADFDAQLMTVITAARNLDNYQIAWNYDSLLEEFENSELTKPIKDKFLTLELTDSHGRILAVTDKNYTNNAEAQVAVSERHNYALFYPLVNLPQGIVFQIVRQSDLQIIWYSAKVYSTWQDALADFDIFIDMLGFETHYHLIGDDECCDKETNCGYQIALTEVKLESADIFNTLEKTINESSSLPLSQIEKSTAQTYGWQRVEQFLSDYQVTDPRFVVRVYGDPTDGGTSYRWALMDKNYVFMRHPIAFHTIVERELRRDTLFEQGQLRLELVTSKTNAQAIIDDLIANNKAGAVAAMSSLDNYFIITESSDTLQYLIGIKTGVSGVLTVLEQEFTQKDMADLLSVVTNLYILTNQTQIIELPEGGKGIEIRGEVGRQSRVLAGLTEENRHDFPKIAVLWETIIPYEKEVDLASALQTYDSLSKEKQNLIATQAVDGSFTISLANPAQILAVAPRRYQTQTAALEAAKEALTYIDTEGFHLLEHVLLRPRLKPNPTVSQTEQDFLLPIYLDKEFVIDYLGNANKVSPFDRYVMGGDPYSMVATVVLPYWSRRFRSVDFREFFENTLRRETPAHIFLNILWISPQQMKDFEKALRCWLPELQTPSTLSFAQRTASLIDILRGLRNTFPPAILSNCGDGIAPVILDKTSIG
ncbi:MAG: hypothetical protein JNL70_16930 [Saprospiraceae bacterium]|nr:hypothetical protein [Saprospiraceae bacterium]